jgi:plasmid replication initiation protein
MALGPDKHTNLDLFISDLGDIQLKTDKSSLEYSFFSLQKRKDINIYRYEGRQGEFIEIIPSVLGRATIWDQDLLIYAISAVIEKRNKGLEIGRTVEIEAYDFLKRTNRSTGGRSYEAIKDGLSRLQGTTFITNVRNGEIENTKGSGFITDWGIKRESDTGKVLEFSLTLNDWLWDAIEKTQILTYSNEYYRITGGLERRLYQLARKHLGKQKEFMIGWKTLYNKSGSSGSEKLFKSRVRKMIAENAGILDYGMRDHGENVVFVHRLEIDKR